MGKHKDQEFKDYVCRLIVEDGRVATEVAYEFEISYGTVISWVSKYKKKLQKDKHPELVTPAELEKLKKQHEKEIQRLREENEILKKAMHIFTKNQE
jgi:transposase